MTHTKLSRRKFIRRAAATGAAVTVAGVLATIPTGADAQIPAQWDYAADVVCMGFGGAGAVTAITAADLGNKVIVLEKQAADTAIKINQTNNTRLSGGAILSTSDAGSLASYLDAISLGERPKEISATWAQAAASNLDWIRRTLGGELAQAAIKGGEWTAAGSDAVEIWKLAPVSGSRGGGDDLFRLLVDNAIKRGVQVLYATSGTQLVTNTKSEVVGVLGESRGKTVAIKANKAVVLTSGGFEYNESMKLNYLRAYPFVFSGNPANSGDGIRMAQELGADLWHMQACSASTALLVPDSPIGVMAAVSVEGGAIFVDRFAAKRFANERLRSHGSYLELTRFDPVHLQYAHTPFWWVFDETRRAKGALWDVTSGIAGPLGLVKLSADLSAEIAQGWILQADTLADLALKMNLNRTALEQTIAEFNQFAGKLDCSGAASDTDFERPNESLAPISTPPYYAVQAWIGGTNTQGGPRKNARCQVLHVTGQPIARLYAAGECGSFLASLYPQDGANLADVFLSGRIAGEQAAAQRPWDT